MASFSAVIDFTVPSEMDLRDPATRKLVEFFQRKGLAALKEEDRAEQWYEDWVKYQAEHEIYASVLSPRQYSSRGREFDLLRYARFFEVFAYFSPAHAYSMQVTFLGLFSILMGSNETLKKQAVAILEAGELFAFGVSEKEHGSDLLGNAFVVRETATGDFVANGSKYYIGNANCASMISILSRKIDLRTQGESARRAPFALIALRPRQWPAFRNVQKIHTLGVRGGFVGSFEVKDQPLPASDFITQGRGAWDAVLGTVTLGKFFLGFGSIGICEHALAEAAAHLQSRHLYGKPVIEMPHIAAIVAEARARLGAMKLYAYRALDYLHAASPDDRRYLLYCAVQKAKVSTEGVKVVSLLSECIGAKGFEADTYFEMALRDIQLIPLLESGAHINLGLAAQFISGYFDPSNEAIGEPASLLDLNAESMENPYLLIARSSAINRIRFGPFLRAYQPLIHLPAVQRFVRKVEAFERLLATMPSRSDAAADSTTTMALGKCMATNAYAQLIAESAARLGVPADVVSGIFDLLVSDFSGDLRRLPTGE